MNKETIIIVAAAGMGMYLISRMIKPTGAAVRPPTGSGTASSLNNNGSPPVTAIGNSALPGQKGFGWQYFSDGTVISPTGQYYLNGQLVWSPGSGYMGLTV